MIYETARFANAEHTLVEGRDTLGINETVSLDHTLFRQPEHGPQGFLARGGVIEPYVEPEPGPYTLYKRILIERMEPAETVTLEATLNAVDPDPETAAEQAKFRQMYHACEYFVSDDTRFAVLHWTIATALGTPEAPNFVRADVLLADGDHV